MYAKLVFRNAKRSVKDYLVYIVTMTICVTLFYAFLSISSSCALPGASCGKQMIARSVPAPVNHHRGSYTSPALAAASYPFVDLPLGNTLRCKLFPSSKFTIHLFPKEAGHSIIKLTTDRFLCGCQRILTHIISDVKAIW